MKKALGLLAVAFVLAACAPAAGRPVVTYMGTAEDVIAVVAEVGPQIVPASGMNYLGVTGISDRFITLQSSTTAFVTFMGGAQTTTITFTVSQQEGFVNVAASGNGPGANDSIDKIFVELDRRFRRTGGQ